MYETILSLAPALVLLMVILFIDRRQPEPFNEILLALAGGVCSVVICLLLGIQTQSMAIDIDEGLGIIRSFNTSFFGAGLPEEAAKLLVLWLLVRRNTHFDERVDGIVYAAFIGLGFAAYENVLYVVQSEDMVETATVRAILSVPGHFMFALLMGYWFSRFWWDKNKRLLKLILALVVPVIAHTAFDFVCFFLGQFEEESDVISIATLGLLLIINIVGFIWARKFIKRQLKQDETIQETVPTTMSRANRIWSRVYVITIIVVACIAITIELLAVIGIKYEQNKKEIVIFDDDTSEQLF